MQKAAIDGGSSLLAAIEASAFGAITKTLSGKVLIEVQAAGVVSKYQLETGSAATTPTDISIYGAMLLNLYDRAIGPTTTYFALGFGQGLTDETQVFQWMLSQLQAVNAYAADHTYGPRH